MAEMDFESDALLKLLTDALRAGPGSPEWHQAIRKLSADGKSNDELKLLVEVRDRLESGKEYRSIRPGPEFTRKVMAGIESEATAGSRGAWPMANLIAVACGLIVLLVLLVVGYQLLSREPEVSPEIQQLALTHFATPAVSLSMAEGVPSDWRRIGQLPVETSKGLKPTTAPSAGDYVGGGLMWNVPIEASEPFAVEVELSLPRLSENVIAQVFVSDLPDFSADRATSGHELVWMLQSGQMRVALADGRIEVCKDKVKSSRDTVELRLVLDRKNAIVDFGGRRAWAGAHRLAEDRPRFVGVRFLRRGAEKTDSVVVQSIRVVKP